MTISSDEYVRAEGNICPVCSSKEIEGRHMEADGDIAWCRVVCLKCGSIWNDIYKLVMYDDLDAVTEEKPCA